MSTKIEWTDETWNPTTGCTKVSAGCSNCYAASMARRFWGERQFSDVRFHAEKLTDPLHWRKPRKIFVNSMSDLFHERVAFEEIDKVLAVIALCPQHTFQVLTKRPERALEYMQRVDSCVPGGELDFDLWDRWREKNNAHDWEQPEFPLKNLWLGVSVENQQAADARIPLLLQCPAAVRFVSCEPLLSAVDLTRIRNAGEIFAPFNSLGRWTNGKTQTGIDWVIAGGETGPGARPMHPDWARGLRDACQASGTPYFFKQWGEWAPVTEETWHLPSIWITPDGRSCDLEEDDSRDLWDETGAKIITRVGKKCAGRLLDGREWNELPEIKP